MKDENAKNVETPYRDPSAKVLMKSSRERHVERLLYLALNPDEFTRKKDTEYLTTYPSEPDVVYVKVNGLEDLIVFRRLPPLDSIPVDDLIEKVERCMREFFGFHFLTTRGRTYEVDFTNKSPSLRLLTCLDDMGID